VAAPGPEAPDQKIDDTAVDEHGCDVEWEGDMQNEIVQRIMPPVGIIGYEVNQGIDEAREQTTEQRGENDRSRWAHEQKDGKVKDYNIGNGKKCKF